MSTSEKVLLLVGSPKGAKSTSESLGMYLLDQLQTRGLKTEKIRIYPSLRSIKGQEDLLSAVDRSDILILSCPLYIDSPPSMIIRAMQLIVKHRKATENPKKQHLMAISNSGFPEAHQNDTALAIYRRFALETDFKWAGGLALGGGQGLNGQPLNSMMGFMFRNAKKSLDLTAEALAKGLTVPQKAIDLMATPTMSTKRFLFFATLWWIYQARKHGARKKLRDRPYEQD